jgi:hypothetical protein
LPDTDIAEQVPPAVPVTATPIGFTPKLAITLESTQLLVAPVSINAHPVTGGGIAWF